MANRFWTCIIVPNASARLHKLRVPERALYALAAVGALSFFVVLALGFWITRQAFQISDHDQLAAENVALKAASMNLASTAKKLETRLQTLETRSDTLSRIIENDKSFKPAPNVPSLIKGTGGSTTDYSTRDLVKNSAIIDLMKDRAIDLEGQMTLLEQKVTFRQGLQRVTPSIWPVKGAIGSGFGGRQDPFTGGPETHPGVDILAIYGSRIMAPADGTVLVAERKGDYGNLVIIDHGNGVTTRFGHLAAFEVKAGQTIRRGDVIGIVGNTGRATAPHLHYEVRLNDRAVNPKTYLP